MTGKHLGCLSISIITPSFPAAILTLSCLKAMDTSSSSISLLSSVLALLRLAHSLYSDSLVPFPVVLGYSY